MSTSSLRRAAALVAVGTALAGCGSAGTTTTRSASDFAAATARVCSQGGRGRTALQRLQTAVLKARGESSLGAMEADIEAALGPTDGQLAKLEKISPPTSSGVTAARWRAATERVRSSRRTFDAVTSAVAQNLLNTSSGSKTDLKSRAGALLVQREVRAGKQRRAAATAWTHLGRRAGLAHSCWFVLSVPTP